MNSKQFDPLKAFVTKDGLLSVTIGVETLAESIELSPTFLVWNTRTGSAESPIIRDIGDFAEDMARTLLDSGSMIECLESSARHVINSGARSIAIRKGE